MGRVRLIRKFAEKINGIDLSHATTGDELELSARDAEMLIAEGWATPVTAAMVAHDREPRRSRRTSRPKPDS